MILLMGFYLIIDAVLSLIKFSRQPVYYQLVRIGRLIIGIFLIVYFQARL